MEIDWTKRILFGFQHALAMFGATVLVPYLTGLDISVALFTAGVGTLLFHLITKRKVPVFLGSSFAFITPILSVKAMYATPGDPDAGLPYATGGMIVAGLVYALTAGLIKVFGPDVMKNLPPVVVGPIIITIGLTLTLSRMTWPKTIGIAIISMLTVALVTVFGKGIYKSLPILLVVQYAASCCLA